MLLKRLQWTPKEKEGEQVIRDQSVFDISVQLVIISGNMFWQQISGLCLIPGFWEKEQ